MYRQRTLLPNSGLKADLIDLNYYSLREIAAIAASTIQLSLPDGLFMRASHDKTFALLYFPIQNALHCVTLFPVCKCDIFDIQGACRKWWKTWVSRQELCSNWPSHLIKSLRILQVLLKSSEDCNIPVFLWGKGYSSWCCSSWLNSMVKWWSSVDEQSPVKWKSSEAGGQILLLEGQPSGKM